MRLHQNKSNIDCNLRPAQKQVVDHRNDRSAVCTAESRARWRAGHHCAATQVRGCMYFHLFIIISIIFVHVFVCLLRLHHEKNPILTAISGLHKNRWLVVAMTLAQKRVIGEGQIMKTNGLPFLMGASRITFTYRYVECNNEQDVVTQHAKICLIPSKDI